MIIYQDLNVKLGLVVGFKHNILEWDCDIVPMKYSNPGNEDTKITSEYLRGVVIYTTELTYTKDATARDVKIRYSNYNKDKFENILYDTYQIYSEQK